VKNPRDKKSFNFVAPTEALQVVTPAPFAIHVLLELISGLMISRETFLAHKPVKYAQTSQQNTPKQACETLVFPCAVCASGGYQLHLAEPRVLGGETHHAGMWVKLQLGWQEAAPAAAAAAAPAAAAQMAAQQGAVAVQG
jgi:hypothetical protein